MKIQYKSAVSILFIMSLVVSAFFSSCEKEDPTKAVITVFDILGAPVAGATVKLDVDPSATNNTIVSYLPATSTTDGSGKAEFEFKLEAVLNIEVWNGNDTVTDFIRLEQGKTIEKSVTLQ